MKSLLLIALLLAPPLARAQTVDAQKRIGFVVEPELSSSLFTVGNTRLPDGTTQTTTFSGLGGGFLLGAKIARVIVGVGLQLVRTASDQSFSAQGMTTTSSASTTSFVVAPGVRVAILRSRDHRVEMFGQLDLGFGTTVTGGSSTPTNGSSTSNFHFSYDVGPGLRYWVHPQFAVGGVTGVRGDFDFASQSSPASPGTTSSSTGFTSVFAALQLTGVF